MQSIGSMRTEEYMCNLLAEMAQAKELVMQLRAHFDQHSPNELCKSVAPKILSCIEKSINLAMLHGSVVRRDSASSENEAPQNNSNRVYKHQHKEMIFKKRRTVPKRTNQVRLSSDGIVDGSVDDGHSWRKYGQKDILGAKHPRGYFSCTHRHTQGCMATKQVQRSDVDPQVLNITYHGTHTCIQGHLKAVQSGANTHLTRQHNQIENQDTYRHGQLQNQDHILISSETGIIVKNDDFNCATDIDAQLSFSKETAPVVVLNPNYIFNSPLTPESLHSLSIPGMSAEETEDKATLAFSLGSDVVIGISPGRMLDSPCDLVSMDFFSNLDVDLFDPSCYLA